MQNAQNTVASTQAVATNALANVRDFASAHKESAIVGSAAAGIVGLAWGATSFLGRRKAKAEAEKAAAIKNVTDKLAEAIYQSQFKRSILPLLKDTSVAEAQLSAWDKVEALLKDKQTRGDLVAADLKTIEDTGILAELVVAAPAAAPAPEAASAAAA